MQAHGRTKVQTNLRVEPGRTAQRLYQFGRGVPVDIVARSVADWAQVGGGDDKAAKLAETIRAKAPAKYEAFQARLAQEKKDIAGAERHWRKAAELSPGEMEAQMDLAKFLARNGKVAESDQLFDKALATGKPAVKYERAKILVEGKRDTAKASQLLNDYLKAELTSDDPSRADAQKLLSNLK